MHSIHAIVSLRRIVLLAVVLAPSSAAAATGESHGSICIAPFTVSNADRLNPNMSRTTQPPLPSSRFEFRVDGRLRAEVGSGEMASISALPLKRRLRVKITLDGRAFETLSLDLRSAPNRRVCLWLYPGYWRWIDNGWNEALGCRCAVE